MQKTAREARPGPANLRGRSAGRGGERSKPGRTASSGSEARAGSPAPRAVAARAAARRSIGHSSPRPSAASPGKTAAPAEGSEGTASVSSSSKSERRRDSSAVMGLGLPAAGDDSGRGKWASRRRRASSRRRAVRSSLLRIRCVISSPSAVSPVPATIACVRGPSVRRPIRSLMRAISSPRRATEAAWEGSARDSRLARISLMRSASSAGWRSIDAGVSVGCTERSGPASRRPADWRSTRLTFSDNSATERSSSPIRCPAVSERSRVISSRAASRRSPSRNDISRRRLSTPSPAPASSLASLWSRPPKASCRALIAAAVRSWISPIRMATWSTPADAGGRVSARSRRDRKVSRVSWVRTSPSRICTDSRPSADSSALRTSS